MGAKIEDFPLFPDFGTQKSRAKSLKFFL